MQDKYNNFYYNTQLPTIFFKTLSSLPYEGINNFLAYILSIWAPYIFKTKDFYFITIGKNNASVYKIAFSN